MKSICACLAAALLLLLFSTNANARSPASANSGASSAADIPSEARAGNPAKITIPGPLRSFLRMAAISQKVSLRQVLPLLAHNVSMEGYGWSGGKARATEYLILLRAYLKHARAIESLAGPDETLHLSGCASAGTLLNALGYRIHPSCGPTASVRTADARKAFLTIDSGFPLTALEDSLRESKPFSYRFASSQVPAVLDPQAWTKLASQRSGRKDAPQDLLDVLVNDPAVARLYWAMARLDPQTASYLEKNPGLEKLLPLAPALDFYGDYICIRNGRVRVPGGPPAENAWKHLVGASPASPGEFVKQLLETDDGWLAAYFDALSRASAAQQSYLTEAQNLHAFYKGLHGPKTTPGAARPVFRPDPGMVLLVMQLRLDPSGQPLVPGGLATWKKLFRDERGSHTQLLRKWASRARKWKDPNQLVAALFGISRLNRNRGLLDLYLTLNEIDRERPADKPLSPQTALLMGRNFSRYGDQYMIFSGFPTLDDSSIHQFIRAAQRLDGIREREARANAIGLLQANISFWEILARQGEIPAARQNASWTQILSPFNGDLSPAGQFDAGQKSLEAVLKAASQGPNLTQEQIITLLAGPEQTSDAGKHVRQVLAERMDSIMEAQRLVPLDTLFNLADGIAAMSQGKPVSEPIRQLAGELKEFQRPKPLFTSSERAEWSLGLYNNIHIRAEMGTNVASLIKSHPSRKKLRAALGELTPFLRDTLVGLNYAYYEPPGAQMVYNNDMLVRSHDFVGEAVIGVQPEMAWEDPTVFGRGLTAIGGAHLAGSLAGLPYALANVEQDFIVPENVQALIWEDLAPTLLADSVVSRWWRVTPDELHAVDLYQRMGDHLVSASAHDPNLRKQVATLLCTRMAPGNCQRINEDMSTGRTEAALAQLSPADTLFLARQFRQEFPRENSAWGNAGQELDRLIQTHPNDVSWKRISEDFGVPHPALSETMNRELLDVGSLPTFLGYSSRLLAETWQSNNLYWARIADQKGYSPVELNLMAPELTRRMVAKIFATDLEDRSALLRALSETVSSVSGGTIAGLPEGFPASGQAKPQFDPAP